MISTWTTLSLDTVRDAILSGEFFIANTWLFTKKMLPNEGGRMEESCVFQKDYFEDDVNRNNYLLWCGTRSLMWILVFKFRVYQRRTCKHEYLRLNELRSRYSSFSRSYWETLEELALPNRPVVDRTAGDDWLPKRKIQPPVKTGRTDRRQFTGPTSVAGHYPLKTTSPSSPSTPSVLYGRSPSLQAAITYSGGRSARRDPHRSAAWPERCVGWLGGSKAATLVDVALLKFSTLSLKS